MYDGLTLRFRFACPLLEEVKVPLSAFRTLERLPGAAHPALYRARFACPCGDEHDGLASHDELDWAPLGACDVSFFNVMTAKLESVATELLDHAVRHIRRGVWPWSFFCYPEERARPVFPSAFRLMSPSRECLAVAVRCPGCSRTSVNLVTEEHVNVPFYNDPRVAVVEHIFAPSGERGLPELSDELFSGSFSARPRDLKLVA